MSHPKPTNTAQVHLPLPPAYQHALLLGAVREQVAVVQQCGAYSTTLPVQLAAATVLAGAATLDGTLTAHSNTAALLVTLAGQRDNEVADLLRVHAGLVTALNLASQGNQAAALAWTGSVKQRTRALPTTDPPVNVMARPVRGVSGAVEVSCKADRRARCYLVQTGADPTHPELWPAPEMGSGCRFRLSGQPLGAKLYFRLALFRNNGQGQWSDVVSVTVK